MTTTPHPNIPLTAVKSSQIESIGHLGDTLAVKFKSGGTYHYHGVSAEQFVAMQKADSAGKFLHAHIKPKHKFTKIV
jgi:hypothetical protein